jgi:hypothetical protein
MYLSDLIKKLVTYSCFCVVTLIFISAVMSCIPKKFEVKIIHDIVPYCQLTIRHV